MKNGMLAHAGGADESLAVALIFAGLWVGWIGWSRIRGTGFPRLPRAGGYAFVVAGVSLLASAAVVPRAIFPATPSGVEAVASAADPADRPTSTATLAIVAPAADAAIADEQMEVVLDLRGGRVVEGTTTDVRPDEGHVHLTLDGKIVSMTYGTVQVVDLRTIEDGPHTLEAEFVAGDHAPFSPRVRASVGFTTGGG